MSEKLKRFEELVGRHDLTFDYSDDGTVWRAGVAELDAIKALARELPRADVERIWNAAADTKLVADAAPRFYWKAGWATATEGNAQGAKE